MLFDNARTSNDKIRIVSNSPNKDIQLFYIYWLGESILRSMTEKFKIRCLRLVWLIFFIH